MKKQDLKVGHYYTNGKGRFRLFVKTTASAWSKDKDWLVYRAWTMRKNGSVLKLALIAR